MVARARLHHTNEANLPGFVVLLLMRALEARRAPTSVLISGARTMVPILHELLAWAKDKWVRELLKHVQLFELDAHPSGSTNPPSPWDRVCKHFATEALRQGILLENQLHPFVFTADREHDCRAYAASLRAFGEHPHVAIIAAEGGGDAPDASIPCHVGAIAAGNAALCDSTEAFAPVAHFPVSPAERVTATPALLRSTEFLIGVMRGEISHSPWLRYWDETTSEIDVPAKLVDTKPTNFFCFDVLMPHS